MNNETRPEGNWQMDDQGRFDNRSIAEMIVTSLFYAKPPVITEESYDRAVDIVEEELIVIDSHGQEWLKRTKRPTDRQSRDPQ